MWRGDYHLNAQEKGLARARNNIDAWWPAIEAGAEAILQTASGCGAFVKEYGQMLKNDALYADKARQVSELAVDLVELLRENRWKNWQFAAIKTGLPLPVYPTTCAKS